MDTGKKRIIILVKNGERAIQIKQLIKATVENVDILIANDTDTAYKITRKTQVTLLISELDPDGENGISSVEQMLLKIRSHELTRFLPVILLHPTNEYRTRAFCDWNCVGYFTYPLCETDFIDKVKKTASAVLADESDNSFVIRRHNVRYPIKVKELVCVKFFDRALHLYMCTGEVFVVEQKPIQMIIEMAKARGVVRCGRGMLVNLMHVEEMDFAAKEIRLRNGEKLKLGETYERELKELRMGIDEIIKQDEYEMSIM